FFQILRSISQNGLRHMSEEASEDCGCGSLPEQGSQQAARCFQETHPCTKQADWPEQKDGSRNEEMSHLQVQLPSTRLPLLSKLRLSKGNLCHVWKEDPGHKVSQADICLIFDLCHSIPLIEVEE
ncbi:hypothetical protein PFISCL1PPCAC_19520, partial [Pristionchus fissidentatus]